VESSSPDVAQNPSSTPTAGFMGLSRLRYWRDIVSHPNYRRVAPWLVLLRKFAPVINVVTLLVSIASGAIAWLNHEQNHVAYLRSVRPTLVVTLQTPSKSKPPDFVFSNPSGADAHDVHIGCTRIPRWTSVYTTIPITERPVALEMARSTFGMTAPVDSNCQSFDAGPVPAGMQDADTVFLPFFACYLDEIGKRHAIARMFSYNPKSQGFQILAIDSPFGKQLTEQTKEQCRATPEPS
jgi:hypothetical protein